MSYEFNSKILGIINEELAAKWMHPEFANKTIMLFSGIHKHTKKHDDQYELGEKSKNYTMKHLKEVITDPEYVTFSIKNNGFVFYKKLMEYVAVTVKQTNDYPEVFCVSTIYPISREKVIEKIKAEKKLISKIIKAQQQELLEKYKYKETV